VSGSAGELFVVFGVAATMWLEICLVSGELLRVLLVRLSSLVRVDDDLIKDLEVQHQKTEIAVALFVILVVEESGI
jgi:hypothetical protein